MIHRAVSSERGVPMKIPFLVTILTGLAVFSAPVLAQTGTNRTDQVHVVFGPPKNAKHQAIRDELMARGTLELLRTLTNPVKLPRRLTLEVRDCDGDGDAFYGDDTVTLCYEYVELIQKHSPKVATPGGVGPADAMVANVLDTMLHEIGHALFDMLDIPVFGREEDAADFFSAYVLLQFDPDDAARLIQGVGFMLASEAKEAVLTPFKHKTFADSHGLPAQRYFNLLCMAYGSDPTQYEKVLSVGLLPKDRAEGCDDEYEMLERSIRKLILPHVDLPRLRQAMAAVTFKWMPLVTAADRVDPVPIAE